MPSRESIGFRALWCVVGIILSIIIFGFVGSLAWLFTPEIIQLFRYLVIVIATVFILILF
jgi:hypothetical protein